MKAALQQKANRDAARHSRQFKHETPYQFAEYNIFTVICGMLLQLAAGHQPASCAPGEPPSHIIDTKASKDDKKKGRDNKKRKRDVFEDALDDKKVPIVVDDGVKVGAVHALSTLIASAQVSLVVGIRVTMLLSQVVLAGWLVQYVLGARMPFNAMLSDEPRKA